jgi:hypothetical protein
MTNLDGSINTLYMNLPNPVPGVTAGIAYATDIYTSFTLIDAHNHTPGYGQLIPVAGLNINATLPLNNNILLNTQSINFNTQMSNAANQSLFFKSTGVSTVDLFAVDGSGNVIRITSGGGVNATSSTLSNGTASAFFSAGTLVVQANVTGPVAGNVDGASFFFRNQSPNSTFAVELSAPASLGANYQLFLPAIPGIATMNIMTLSTGGVMGTTTADSVVEAITSVGADSIATTMTTNGTTAIAATISSANANTIIDKTTITATIGSKYPVVSNSTPSTGRLAIAYCRANAVATITSNQGISTVVHTATGVYTITFATNFTTVPAITLTIDQTGVPLTIQTDFVTVSGCQIEVLSPTSVFTDAAFNLIAIGTSN